LDGLRERRGGGVSALGIAQTLAWGSSYYLAAVFADPISAGLGIPRSWFFGVFSAAPHRPAWWSGCAGGEQPDLRGGPYPAVDGA